MTYDPREEAARKKIREEQKEQKLPLFLMNEQHAYNRDLLKEQHAFNEKLFEKQSELSRGLHKKQTNLAIQIQDSQESLTIVLAIISLVAALSAAILGAVVVDHLSSTSPMPSQKESQTAASKTPLNKQQPTSYKEASSPNPTLNQTTNDGSDLDKVKVNKQ